MKCIICAGKIKQSSITAPSIITGVIKGPEKKKRRTTKTTMILKWTKTGEKTSFSTDKYGLSISSPLVKPASSFLDARNFLTCYSRQSRVAKYLSLIRLSSYLRVSKLWMTGWSQRQQRRLLLHLCKGSNKRRWQSSMQSMVGLTPLQWRGQEQLLKNTSKGMNEWSEKRVFGFRVLLSQIHLGEAAISLLDVVGEIHSTKGLDVCNHAASSVDALSNSGHKLHKVTSIHGRLHHHHEVIERHGCQPPFFSPVRPHSPSNSSHTTTTCSFFYWTRWIHTLKRKNLTNEPTKEQQPSHINQALQLYGFYHKKNKKKSRIGARGAWVESSGIKDFGTRTKPQC